jgi:hypothetical protein
MKTVWMAVCLVALTTVARAAGLPSVAVAEDPTASRWLTAAGIQHTLLTQDQLTPAGLASAQVLILPVERVRTAAAAHAVIQFSRRGGGVLAVYWGPLVREASESTQPCYALQEVLGAKPTGWRGTGPITLRTDTSAPRGGSAGAETSVPRGILAIMRPSAEAKVIAWWTPAGSANGAPEAAAVRLGSVVYTNINLFALPNDTPAVRQFFFSLLDQLVPSLALEQARERAAAAMTAVIHADTEVSEAEAKQPSLNFSPVRQLLEQARDAAAQAKERVAKERYRESGTAAELAQSLVERARELLAKLTTKGK